jgi:hypothetical protein
MLINDLFCLIYIKHYFDENQLTALYHVQQYNMNFLKFQLRII